MAIADTAPAASAAPAVLMALGRHLLTAAGVLLARHGWIDQQTATSAVEPLAVIDYVGKGGFKGVVADAEAFARQVIESTLADLTSTKAVQIGRAVLSALGIK